MRPEVEKFSIEKAESYLRPIGKLTLPSLREPRDLAPSEWPKSSFTPQGPAPEWRKLGARGFVDNVHNVLSPLALDCFLASQSFVQGRRSSHYQSKEAHSGY